MRTRSGRNVTESLPELAGLAEQVPDGTVLDGELVPDGGRGVDFYKVAPSMMAVRRRRAPLAYVVFDVPHLAGEPTIGLTHRDRRRLLELLELSAPAWCTVPSFDAEADEVLEECARLRLEGLAAKRVDSRYEPGGSAALIGLVGETEPRPGAVGRPGATRALLSSPYPPHLRRLDGQVYARRFRLEGRVMFIALSLVFVLLAAAVRYRLVALVDKQTQPG